MASGAATTAAWLAWLTVPGLAATMILGFLVGLSVCPMRALCTARAYATGVRPGVVAAVARPFVIVELAAPLLLGLVADRFGLGAALVLLLVQPAAVVMVAACQWDDRTTRALP